MTREEFLLRLEKEFPEAYSSIDEYEKGQLHCEMGAFRVYVEKAMLNGQEWSCEKAFSFIDKCLSAADPELKNAIEISFIEDLALGEQNKAIHKIIKERAPKDIREKMIEVDDYWS